MHLNEMFQKQAHPSVLGPGEPSSRCGAHAGGECALGGRSSRLPSSGRLPRRSAAPSFSLQAKLGRGALNKIYSLFPSVLKSVIL